MNYEKKFNETAEKIVQRINAGNQVFYYQAWIGNGGDECNPAHLRRALEPRTRGSLLFQRNPIAEAILAAQKVEMNQRVTCDSSYDSVANRINFPTAEQFFTAEGYYQTLFHEHGHATGHPSRLNRPRRG